MELLVVCEETTYFHVEDRFYQHRDGMDMAIPLWNISKNPPWILRHTDQLCVSNTWMAHLAFGSIEL
jgi:hypothetical protein